MDALIKQCPNAKILITSRELLHLRGEKVFLVPPLKVPEEHKRAEFSAESVTQYEEVQLFIQTALSVQQDFQVTNDNAPAVAEICVKLDGIPLAIELVASRIRLFPPRVILKRLEHRLNLLTSGAYDLPARQKTLRAAIDWSYDQLDEEEKFLFGILSVFTGNFSIDAAVSVLNTLKGDNVGLIDGIESLVDKSLLIKGEMLEDEVYFYMLGTLSEYGKEKLKQAGSMNDVMNAYTFYYQSMAESAGMER